MQKVPPAPDDTRDASRDCSRDMTTIFRRPSTAASPSHADGVMRHGFASFFRAPVVEDMVADPGVDDLVAQGIGLGVVAADRAGTEQCV